MVLRYKTLFSPLFFLITTPLLYGKCYDNTLLLTHGAKFLHREYSAKRGKKIPNYSWRLYHHQHQKPVNFLSVEDNNKSASRPKECYIRVLLRQAPACSWHLESQDGFYVRWPQQKKLVSLRWANLHFSGQLGQLCLNNKSLKSSDVELIPRYGRIVFDGIEYEGSFIITYENGHYLLVNKLPLEKYLYSVVNSESWPGWPLEVNKAFVVACRSYVLAEKLKPKTKKRAYDVKNSNIHQTYRGFHTNHLLRKAVEETRGMVLVHNQRPIVAMFDCCCGGVIPAHMQDVDFKKAPYLARTAACNFCKNSKLYRWKLEIDLEELQVILRKNGINVKTLSDLTILKKDKAGIVKEIMVHETKSKHTLDAKKLYSWLKPLKSYCYSIRKKYRKIHLEGKGYGHHLGMCQWGARAMIDHGFTYKQILNFYYPETQLMKISYS